MGEVIKKALTDKSARNTEVLRAVATDDVASPWSGV